MLISVALLGPSGKRTICDEKQDMFCPRKTSKENPSAIFEKRLFLMARNLSFRNTQVLISFATNASRDNSSLIFIMKAVGTSPVTHEVSAYVTSVTGCY